MAIYQLVYQKAGTNTAAIVKALDWASRLRPRMADGDMVTYGACNTLRLVNKSNLRIRIHFSWGPVKQRFEDMEGNSIRNITVDDGINFYGFDIENLDAATDIAIGEISYKMSKTLQHEEGK